MHIGGTMNKKDVKLILECLIFCLFSFGIFYVMNKNHIGNLGIVEYKEEVLLEFDLTKNETYEFEGSQGIVHLEVKDGQYRVYDVECPNHDCEQMGWHDKDSLTPIVCLPNEIVIYSKSED